MPSAITYDLSRMGGPSRISALELAELAARAKTRVKANPATGWSLLSHLEVLALVWAVDLVFEDRDLGAPPPATPEPPVISHV